MCIWIWISNGCGGCACGATVTVAPEAGSRSSRSPGACPQCSPASSPQTTPRRTIAAMATADERELQINPIVASSVQHNTQVRLSTSIYVYLRLSTSIYVYLRLSTSIYVYAYNAYATPTLRLRPPRAPPQSFAYHLQSTASCSIRPRFRSSILTTVGHVQHPQPDRLALRRRRWSPRLSSPCFYLRSRRRRSLRNTTTGRSATCGWVTSLGD
jgi:hypothetical protein